MSPDLSKVAPDAKIRTFLAIDLPPDVKRTLASAQPAFALEGSLVKWVAPDLLHITVRFLGGVPTSRLESVHAAAADAVSAVRPFSLAFSGIGAFPNERMPRVIWIGLSPTPALDLLRDLFREVQARLADAGFPREEQRFSPHITIGRARDRISNRDRRLLGEALQRARQAQRIEGSFLVEALLVMRSQLISSGPRYTALARFPLGRKEGRDTRT